jgi:hypothetical protein
MHAPQHLPQQKGMHAHVRPREAHNVQQCLQRRRTHRLPRRQAPAQQQWQQAG